MLLEPQMCLVLCGDGYVNQGTGARQQDKPVQQAVEPVAGLTEERAWDPLECTDRPAPSPIGWVGDSPIDRDGRFDRVPARDRQYLRYVTPGTQRTPACSCGTVHAPHPSSVLDGVGLGRGGHAPSHGLCRLTEQTSRATGTGPTGLPLRVRAAKSMNHEWTPMDTDQCDPELRYPC